ncbi:MAG: hypothetical protein E7234_03865 [Lachnospiraceae bacterium]|nr:hypothetical protein [Lachnospiraceae bacterium]
MKELKSKVLKEFDFRKADVSEVDFTYEADKGFIEKELLRIKKKNAVTYEVDAVIKGDIVLCSLRSDNPKYNKEISVNSSLGIFKKEVAGKLNGMKKGETLTVSVDGDDVNIEILKIERRELPEILTDEMVEKEEIESVSTVKALEKHLQELHQKNIDSAINTKAYYLVEHVLKQVVPQSQYEIYEEDIQYLYDLEIQKASALAKNEGLILEKMTEEAFNGRIPVKSYEEFLNMVHNMGKNQIYVLVMGLKKAKEDGYEPSKEEYEEFLKGYYTMYKMDPEVARKAQSWELYEANEYIIYYRRQIINYYRERYQEV